MRICEALTFSPTKPNYKSICDMVSNSFVEMVVSDWKTQMPFIKYPSSPLPCFQWDHKDA